MSLFRLIFDVRHGNRDSLGFVAHGTAFGDFRIRLELRQSLGGLNRQQGSCQSRLAVVNVADGAYIAMRLAGA